MILKEKTKQVYGYEAESLAPTSAMPVFWQCDNCSYERQYSYTYYLKKKEHSSETDGKELCQKCGHSHRKGTASKVVNKNSFYPLPPETDIQATMERFGYDPYSLSPWSRDRVIVRCKVTGKICSPKRCSLNRYKSIIETGHFISTGAWTAERRKGKKASEETIQKMKKNQQARRMKEKQEPNDKNKAVNSTLNPYHMPYKPSV